MVRGLSPSDERFLAALSRVDERISRSTHELSSGYRISAPSDAPDQISRVLTLRAGIEATVQARTNLERVKTEADTAESALSQAVTVLEKINVLGAQGATGTQESAGRLTIGQQVRDLLEQLVTLAATNVQGKYVFSGDRDTVAPYTVDLTGAHGVSAYQGSAATNQVQHPAGTRFSFARTAAEIFDDTTTSVFGAVNTLRLALEGGPAANDPNYATLLAAQTTAIQDAMSGMEAAQDHLNRQLSHYGMAQNRVAEALTFSHSFETRQRAELSGIEDADVTEAMLELNEASLQREAALKARASRPSGSLFDHM